MFLIISAVVVLSVLAQCDISKNDPVLNEDCNNAGTCVEYASPFGSTYGCECCAPSDLDPVNICGDHWVCDPADPFPTCMEWSGSTCTSVTNYRYVGFGFRALETDENEPADMYCNTDPQERALYNIYRLPSLNIVPQVEYVLKDLGWTAPIKGSACDTCAPAYPCTFGTNTELNVTTGNTFGFQVDYNEYYDESCKVDGVLRSVDDQADCPANYDYGQRANKAWDGTSVQENGESVMLLRVNELLYADPDASNDNLGLSFQNTRMLFMSENIIFEQSDVEIRSPTENPTQTPTSMPTSAPTEVPTLSPTSNPTEVPTLSPTSNPTEMPTSAPTTSPTEIPTPMPTQTPTYECGPYSNDVDDLSFIGVGSNCRGGLNSSYVGGLTCDSPYVICLPQENTPAALADQDYKNSTHRYSVDECLQECANDQRCSGIEFVADPSSSLGDCNLIDDIPVVITSMVNSGFEYDSTMMYTNLDNSETGAEALCFQKEDYCNPYFEAEDLSDEMLDCYCPNNRKGFYTKKVKRTVANSRFCGNDTEVDIRIQKAQANRMFHLCENWCLFLTEDPEAESWYYDPWKSCYREQYATGSGDHRSYCTRVIYDPDTIEIQFIHNRVQLACNGTVEGY